MNLQQFAEKYGTERTLELLDFVVIYGNRLPRETARQFLLDLKLIRKSTTHIQPYINRGQTMYEYANGQHRRLDAPMYYYNVTFRNGRNQDRLHVNFKEEEMKEWIISASQETVE